MQKDVLELEYLYGVGNLNNTLSNASILPGLFYQNPQIALQALNQYLSGCAGNGLAFSMILRNAPNPWLPALGLVAGGIAGVLGIAALAGVLAPNPTTTSSAVELAEQYIQTLPTPTGTTLPPPPYNPVVTSTPTPTPTSTPTPTPTPTCGSLLAGGMYPNIPTISYADLIRCRAETAPTIALIVTNGPFLTYGAPCDPHCDNRGYYNGNGHLPPPSDPSRRVDTGYREYTVITPGISHRGQRRIITSGSPGRTSSFPYVEMYYTENHYTTFVRVQI